MSSADAKEISAFLKRLQLMMQEEMDRVQELLQKMQDNVSDVMSILSSGQDSRSQMARYINA